MQQQIIKIDDCEIEDNSCYYLSISNFFISKNFKFYDFTDSFTKYTTTTEIEISTNRSWGQRNNNIYNLKKLCNELLEPLVNLVHDIPIIDMGILNEHLIKKFSLGKNCLMWFGKAAMIKFKHKDNFKIFMQIVSSNLKFGELIYFSYRDMIYITLPTEVVKNIIKVKK